MSYFVFNASNIFPCTWRHYKMYAAVGGNRIEGRFTFEKREMSTYTGSRLAIDPKSHKSAYRV